MGRTRSAVLGEEECLSCGEGVTSNLEQDASGSQAETRPWMSGGECEGGAGRPREAPAPTDLWELGLPLKNIPAKIISIDFPFLVFCCNCVSFALSRLLFEDANIERRDIH